MVFFYDTDICPTKILALKKIIMKCQNLMGGAAMEMEKTGFDCEQIEL